MSVTKKWDILLLILKAKQTQIICFVDTPCPTLTYPPKLRNLGEMLQCISHIFYDFHKCQVMLATFEKCSSCTTLRCDSEGLSAAVGNSHCAECRPQSRVCTASSRNPFLSCISVFFNVTRFDTAAAQVIYYISLILLTPLPCVD